MYKVRCKSQRPLPVSVTLFPVMCMLSLAQTHFSKPMVMFLTNIRRKIYDDLMIPLLIRFRQETTKIAPKCRKVHVHINDLSSDVTPVVFVLNNSITGSARSLIILTPFTNRRKQTNEFTFTLIAPPCGIFQEFQ